MMKTEGLEMSSEQINEQGNNLGNNLANESIMNRNLQRKIASVRTVQFRENSPTHKVGLVLEPGKWEAHDPFLLMAEDTFEKGTFGKHPHRGIETVTYVIEGTLEHFDNQSGKDELHPGDVQWMTAGQGVIHLEDPAEGVTVHSLQLWINLPSEKKMVEPRYQNLRADDMPVWEEDGARIRVFSGSSKGMEATTKNHVPVTMVEMTLEAGTKVTQDIPSNYRGFLYILKGSGFFGSNNVEAMAGQVLWMDDIDDTADTSNGNISEIHVQAHRQECLKVLLYAGQPIRERVVARGPFVMNTEEEIRQAYQDYQEGKFV